MKQRESVKHRGEISHSKDRRRGHRDKMRKEHRARKTIRMTNIEGTDLITPLMGVKRGLRNYSVALLNKDSDQTEPLFSVFGNRGDVNVIVKLAKERVLQDFVASEGGNSDAGLEKFKSSGPIRFLDIYISSNNGILDFNIANVEVDPDPQSGIESLQSSPIQNSEFESLGLKKILVDYICCLMHNSDTQGLLDIPNNKCLKITIDFYVGRPSGAQVGLHKDTTHKSNTAYVFLSFENDDNPIFGPELISLQMDDSWKISDSVPGNVKTLNVLRPQLPIKGTVGFNDKLLSHSSPANDDFGDVKVVRCDCNPDGGVQFIRTHCRLVSSHDRTPVPIGSRPNFLRTWFQLADASDYTDFTEGEISDLKKPHYLCIMKDFGSYFKAYNKQKRTNPIYKPFVGDSAEFMRENGDNLIEVLGGTTKTMDEMEMDEMGHVTPITGIVAKHKRKNRNKKKRSKKKSRKRKNTRKKPKNTRKKPKKK